MAARREKRHSPYPDLPNHARVPRSAFEEVLGRKREFRAWERRESDNGDEARRDPCSKSGRFFDLSHTQTFLAAYLSPLTPYRSILMFHDTGVGKTCAAVRIAEAFASPRPAIVLAPEATRGGFKANLVNHRGAPLDAAGGVDVRRAARASCTGSTYLRGLPEGSSRADLRAFAQGQMRARYVFFGYEQFNNRLEYTTERIRGEFASLPEEEVEREVAQTLRREFSDRVIVVDEAHNLRQSSRQKDVLGKLRAVLRHAANVTLVLMTATPMYNRPDEVLDLLNLMLVNDGVRELAHAEVFDADGGFVEGGEERLANAFRGRVSRARAQTEGTFPLRLSARDAGVEPPAGWRAWPPPPALATDGSPVPRGERVAAGAMFSSQLSAAQAAAYAAVVARGNMSAAMYTPAQEVCNFVGGGETGEAGFFRVFKRVAAASAQALRLEYRRGRARLAGTALMEAAPKVAAICDLLERSEGGALVYSRFKWAGVLPVAVALEERGWAPFKGRPLLRDVSPRAGAPRYALVTSDETIGGGASATEVVHAFNTGASGIRAVLGTNRVAEGLDFRGLREVHVMEPWFHMSVAEQVVGRAVRFCSHSRAEKEARNVTVFMHCACLSAAEARRETVDERMFRLSVSKQRRVGAVMRVLRDAAVDCGLTGRSGSGASARSGSAGVRGSQGQRVSAPAGDRDGSAACDYGACAASAPRCPPPPTTAFDFSTFHPMQVRHEVDMACWDAVDALKETNAQRFSELLAALGCDEVVLALALQVLLNPLEGSSWLRGSVLLFRAGRYVLLPAHLVERGVHKRAFLLSEARSGALEEVANEAALK